ncbi:hypothetical protein DUNSADRAFT_17175 [Dunaliella salina]|uniref:G-patch domain-containing protein n=1 Tax=Dunaliella salina TaxID=3046 RepID=A0ABQ7G291_DUNSA|nr:hypothetical protein DUNSADRAFT_17175 [Dunaliella salina]|eukprot:KAF5828723.1 hypothetical protein DUNSADRAFT_17175 [Dunaliella salina]
MKLPQNYVPGEGVRKPTGYGGKGQRMLELMGWRKGQGLGPAKDGMREALDTKEKKDTAGIGAKQSWDWTAKFWEESYNSIAGKIQHEHDSSSEDDSSSDDDDKDAVTAVANKRRRSSGAGASTSSSSSSSSSDSDDPSPAKASNRRTKGGPAASSSGKKQGAPEREGVNRVGWRGRAGKLARVAQHEAAEAARLAALLEGGDKQGPGESQQQQQQQQQQREAAAVAGTQRNDAGGHKRGGADKGKSAPGKRIVVTLSIPEDPSIKPMAFKPTPLTGWWGAGYFRSVGAMGGVEEEKAEAEAEKEKDTARKLGFDEDDQAALYMQAHNHQRRGHTGLGQSTRTLKIAGGKWEGSRKTFEEDEEEEEGVSKQGCEEDGDRQEAGGKSGKGKKKKKKGRKSIGRSAEDGVAEEADEKSKRRRKKQKKSGQEGAAEEVSDGREEKVGTNGTLEESKRRRKKQKRSSQEGPAEGANNGTEEKGGAKANGKASRKKCRGSQDADVNGSAEGVPYGSDSHGANGRMGKPVLKLAQAIIQEAPKRKMKIGKLCARLVQRQGGSQEALSIFLHRKVSDD